MSFKDFTPVFELLSEVLLDPETTVSLRARTFCGSPGIPQSICSLLGRMSRASAEKRGSLSSEYIRLFLVGNNGDAIQPYESVQTRGRLMDPTCLDAIDSLYKRMAFVPRKDIEVPPDHLGIEFAFMARLLKKIGEAEVGGPEERKFIELAGELIHEHLEGFVAAFTARLLRLEPSDYFKAACEIMREAVAEVSARLDEGAPPTLRD